MPIHALSLRRALEPGVFLLALVPFASLVWRALHEDLGANPVETLSRVTGNWTLRFLLLMLAVTPAAPPDRLARVRPVAAHARALWLLRLAAPSDVRRARSVLRSRRDPKDIAERPSVTVGFASFLLLVPHALTSTDAAMRRQGGRRWRRLHRLIFAVALGGIVHYLWLVQSDITQPLLYYGAVAVLPLGWRLWEWWWRRLPRALYAQGLP